MRWSSPIALGARMDREAIAVEVLRIEIAKRLRSICTHIPETEFDAYVDRLAHVERSYEFVDDLESLSRERQAPPEYP
jgi:hypothetical protein